MCGWISCALQEKKGPLSPVQPALGLGDWVALGPVFGDTPICISNPLPPLLAVCYCNSSSGLSTCHSVAANALLSYRVEWSAWRSSLRWPCPWICVARARPLDYVVIEAERSVPGSLGPRRLSFRQNSPHEPDGASNNLRHYQLCYGSPPAWLPWVGPYISHYLI